MLCKKPFVKALSAYGCGQCLPCRINRGRLWTHRLLLETLKHGDSCFVTLTYNEENLPTGNTLVLSHYQEMLKRLRKTVQPLRIRYFVVGEYGDETQRPHYHMALYGIGPLQTSIIEKSWGHGHIHVGTLTKDSAAYITQYVTKKMTSKEDPRLNGRYPEFARMSLKPGIGAHAMEDIRQSLETNAGCDLLEQLQDVPNALQHGSKKMPLGRYLKRKLREAYGFKNPNTPPEILLNLQKEMQELLVTAYKNPRFTHRSDKAILISLNKQKSLNMEKKFKIFKKGQSL